MRFAVFIVVCCLLPAATSAQTDDAEAIRKVFRSYRTAIAVRNGERAQHAVTSETFAYYDRMRDLALHAGEASTRALPLFDKLMVLSFRLRMTAVELQSISGAGLFAAGVQRGWIGDTVASASDVASIQVSGDQAVGLLVSGTRTTGIEVKFKREQGEWLFDLIAMGPAVAEAIKQGLKQAGIDEDAYVLRALAEQTGADPPPTIWAALAE